MSKQSRKAALVKLHSMGKINLSDIEFYIDEESFMGSIVKITSKIEDKLNAAAREAACAFAKSVLVKLLQGTVYASFAISWASGDNPSDGHGGPPVDDPLTMTISLPTEDIMDGDAWWRFSVMDCVRECIEDQCGSSGEFCGDIGPLIALRDGFLLAAKELDDFVKKQNQDA